MTDNKKETRIKEAHDMELKRCPFCGSDEVGLYVNPDPDQPPEDWYIRCHGCFAKSGDYDDPVESVQKWNGRVVIISC